LNLKNSNLINFSIYVKAKIIGKLQFISRRDLLVKKKIFIPMVLLFVSPLRADDLSNAYGQTIKLASGYEQLIKKSPSTVSVITKEDIERIGAITIEEVLQTIPGILVSHSIGYLPVYSIRGIDPDSNGAVLIHYDGIPINNAKTSSSLYVLGRLAKNIERIEIIKGSGSALYGANAFSGVINIITKKKKGVDAGTFIGSNDNFGGWLNIGKDFDNFKVNFSAQGQMTNGGNEIIETDKQSFIDSAVGTNASLAPGGINKGHDEIDLKLESSYKDKASLYLRYIKKINYGFGVGLFDSLDNSGKSINEAWLLGANYTMGDETLKTKFDIYYSGGTQLAEFNIFPSGAVRETFKTPVSRKTTSLTHELETKISTIYSGLNNHKLHLGIGFEYDSIDNITDERNFIVGGPFGISPSPSGLLQSARSLGRLPIIFPTTRYNYYGFLQDEWQLFNDLALTAGVRADYFSDFGLTINPRASLVWTVSSSLTAKLMYGRAFNAPSFFEFYTNPRLAATGNRELNPETIQTVELSLYKMWPYKITTQLNLFWYETSDVITQPINYINNSILGISASGNFSNTEGVNTYGLELDFEYQVTDTLKFNFNYTFLDLNPKDSMPDYLFVVSAPEHQTYASINWEFSPNWSANLRSTSVIGRKRAGIDTRGDVKDYTQIDFTLSRKQVLGILNLTFKIDNLLDSDIREPSINDFIPEDYPLEGRTFMGILSVDY
jgi:iron complex outermembrane receptor protein